MNKEIDILENEILERYPNVLGILLRDHTTQKNILWATDNYSHIGQEYESNEEIQLNGITGDYGNLIMPRVQKDKLLQVSRSKDMAEVFTPSWICNAQNNLIDNAWFDKKNTFNIEIQLADGRCTWQIKTESIKFPLNKTWKHYVRDNRLETACGEAPYITSRYDTTTGEFIPIANRIGILDRKLRVINENVNSSGVWLKAAQTAFKSTYAYEWQGDSLLLAREAMLFTFIENYQHKFDTEPLLKSIKYIAYIISWNIWQMDGLKGVVPNTCETIHETNLNLFGIEETKSTGCLGCQKEELNKHNGKYCLIKDWVNKDKITGKKGRRIRFIDLIKK